MKVRADSKPSKNVGTRSGEIYQCAAELIVQKGFGHATIAEISRRMKMTKPGCTTTSVVKLRELRPDLATRHMLSTLRGIGYWYPLTIDVRVEETVESIVTFILGGLLKPKDH